MRKQRPLVERARAGEALHDRHPEPGPAVFLVGEVLGNVDVQPVPGLDRRRDTRLERRLAEGERGVRADHRARERDLAHRAARRNARREPAVLADPGRRALRSVAVGHLVREDAPDPQLLERLGDDIERPVDRVR